jgi:formylglycine-generating enzyme required for sulfatase activity
MGCTEKKSSCGQIPYLVKKAEEGDYQAQYDLGLLFAEEKKYEESVKWLVMAAKQGLPWYEQSKQEPPVEKQAVRVLMQGAAETVSESSSQGSPQNSLVNIEGGAFMMGSPPEEVGRYDNETQHQVMVSSFYIGKYNVTQKEYMEVMGLNPSKFRGDNMPVENVSWLDAVQYCNRLSQRENLTLAYTINGEQVSWNRDANGYRLPTEAEWEYACRGGTTTPFNTGTHITTFQANYNGNYPYDGNIKGTYRERTTAVGSFTPNTWGLSRNRRCKFHTSPSTIPIHYRAYRRDPRYRA